MRNAEMRKVKCGIQKCGNVCGMVGKMRIAEIKVYTVEHRIKPWTRDMEWTLYS